MRTELMLHQQQPLPLAAAFAATRSGFLTAIVFSFFINLLAFVGPIYMLQVYDRVITSRNELTLLFITLLAAYLLVVYALLERCRSAVLIRLGMIFNEKVRDLLFRAVMRQSLRAPEGGHAQAVRDLDQLREFATGSGFITLFDAPWVPIFIAACFLLHPWFGWLATGGTLIMLALAVLNELATRHHLNRAAQSSVVATEWVNICLRNIEAAHAMAMIGSLQQRWRREHDNALGWQASASDRAGLLVATTKFTRAFLQISSLAIGGYLVIGQEVTGGAMIAASILMTRALAPVEAAVSSWNGFVMARIGYRRIRDLLSVSPEPAERLTLPEPQGHVRFEQVSARAPNGQSLVLSNVSFAVDPGEVLAVIGPSAAGKSSLVRVLVGIWPALGGAVRLDGAELAHWEAAQLGPNIGYLPQDVELVAGTVAENIARLGPVDHAAVTQAARMAGVHGLIQTLPDGYNTPIGAGGMGLSGGQRQRIGLARAIYRLPALIVLDEPNSNLDADGETALLSALAQLRAARRSVVVVTHKRNVLAAADKVLVLAHGEVQSFGSREAVLPRLALAVGQATPIRRAATTR
jgi:ATP-binding cassette subfamily C protein